MSLIQEPVLGFVKLLNKVNFNPLLIAIAVFKVRWRFYRELLMLKCEVCSKILSPLLSARIAG